MQTAARATQKELVRLLVLEHGLQKASELSGVPYELVRQWESRRQRKEKRIVTNVTKTIVDNVQADLADHEKETRLSLARSARRMAKDAEQCTLRDADKALKVGQLAGIVHKWNDGKANESFSLNVLNMGALEVRVGKEAAPDDQP